MLLVFYAAQHKNLTEYDADICVWPLEYMDIYVYRLQQQVDRNKTRVKLA